MKNIVFVYPSALQFWMSSEGNLQRYHPDNRVLTSVPSDHRLVSLQAPYDLLAQQYQLSFPVKILADKANHRFNNSFMSCSVRSEKVPQNSFVRIHNTPDGYPVYIACPEYCFLSAASHLSFWELVMLGYQLCACFAPDSMAEYQQRSRTPIISAAKIAAFLDHCKGAHGISNASQAISNVLDNAGSPMEIKLAMASTLPFFRGGVAIIKPELNAYPELTAKAREQLGYDCRCDMLWRIRKTAAEYDSNSTHLDRHQHAIDKDRSTALSLSGYKVISITSDFINSFQSYEETLVMLRWSLGMRKAAGQLERYLDRRYELYKFLRQH